ncbi:hypothetical protein ACS0TY_030538 [Phlomoides rotata]
MWGKMKKCGLTLVLDSEEMDTGAVVTRSNSFDYHSIWSSSEAPASAPLSSEATSPPPMALYLFYDHYGSSKSSHSLYKIDIQFTPAITRALSLVWDFPIEEYAARGMRCARLGSKIYFLGGTDERAPQPLFPREVYVLELLTREFKPMTARLNAGKPRHSTVFAGNGKVYALAMIPYCPKMSPTDRLSLSLFEYFDPSIGRWQVLDNLPTRSTDKGVFWMGCTILEKRQEVVLLGREYPNRDQALAKFVYNLRENKWTRHSLGIDLEGLVTLSFQEGGDDYLYGLGNMGPPLKSISGYISFSDEVASYGSHQIDGFAKMSIPTTPTPKEEDDDWPKWVYNFFHQPYLDWPTRSLRYLGNDLFCYIASGMLPSPYGPDPYGYLDSDHFSRGILITLFKELKKNQGGEEKLSFQAEILHSEDYGVLKMKNSSTMLNWSDVLWLAMSN